MTANEYTNLAMRTCVDNSIQKTVNACCFDTKFEDVNVGDLLLACLGLSGEIGEVNDIVKKSIYHGHEFNKQELKKELGDIMWYIALMCKSLQIELDDVCAANIEKLKNRYPDGFSDIASINRKD